jgi:hypothetical protein
MTPRRPSPHHPAVLKRDDHKRLWRAVAGAVVDTLKSHPEYITDAGQKHAVLSITKRVVGNVVALVHETRKGGRASGCQAGGAANAPASGGVSSAVVGAPAKGAPESTEGR